MAVARRSRALIRSGYDGCGEPYARPRGCVSISPLGYRSATSNSASSAHQATLCYDEKNSSGYRMAEVNSRRESRASERDSELPAPAHGAQPPAKNGRIPELFRADRSAERVSPEGVLADREEPGSNTLCAPGDR